jgi:hypothetical protein
VVDREHKFLAVLDVRGGVVVVGLGVAAHLVVVGELFLQSVDVSAAALEREIAEHVVERAVFEHQHHDVGDRLEGLGRGGRGGGGQA